MIHPNAELLLGYHRNVLKGLERQDRQGKFWRREEAIRSLEKAVPEKPRFQNQILLKIGDFLVSLSLRLREQGKSGTPAAAF